MQTLVYMSNLTLHFDTAEGENPDDSDAAET